MNRAAFLLLQAALALPLAACAQDREAYPSLARRPQERISVTTPPAPPSAPAIAPAVPDPALEARLAVMVERARGAHGRFQALRDRAERLVAAARGSAVGGESWAVASVALAELESAHSNTMVVLADLDSLHAASSVETGPVAAITDARADVDALARAEDDILGRLRDSLGG